MNLTKLIFKKFKIKNNFDNCYHIYENSHNYIEIFASNANEAIEKSNILAPYKVVHYDIKLKKYFQAADLQEENLT